MPVEFSFNAKNQLAQEQARKRAASLVTGVSRETKKGIRGIITQSINEGIPPLQAARMIKQSIGLTGRQSATAARYRASLVESGISEEKVEKAYERYVNKQLRRRSESIARTEILSALNAGSLESWKQAKKQGFLPKNARKKWIVTKDEILNKCPICKPINGQEQAFNKPFVLGDGRKAQFPPAHPMCRCTLADPSAIVPLDLPPSLLVDRLPDMMSGLGEYGISVIDPTTIDPEFFTTAVSRANRTVRSAVSLDSMRRAGDLIKQAGALMTENLDLNLRAVLWEMPGAVAAVPLTEQKRQIAINLMRPEWNSREDLALFVRRAINGQDPESALIHEYGHAAWLKARNLDAGDLSNWNFYRIGIGDEFLPEAAEGDIWSYIRHNLGEYAGANIGEFMAETFRIIVEHGRHVVPDGILRIYDALEGPKIRRGGVR
jgi:SPP1 gp7 family putative phage head morphogenesis protein